MACRASGRSTLWMSGTRAALGMPPILPDPPEPAYSLAPSPSASSRFAAGLRHARLKVHTVSGSGLECLPETAYSFRHEQRGQDAGRAARAAPAARPGLLAGPVHP